MKALVGNQKNLPQALKAQIKASPAKNMNKGYGSPAKQVSATELKTTTKNTGGLSKTALANAGRDMLKADYGINNPNMSNETIADSIKKYGRTDEVRSRVKQGFKKGDNEGEFEGSFGSPAQMESPAKQVTKGSVTQASQLDKSRRVDAGTVIRKKDYDLSTKEGQQSFKDDSTALRAIRRANNQKALASVKTANATGDSQTKKAAQAAKRTNKVAEGKQVVTDAKKVSKTDKKKDVSPTTFVVSKKGVKAKSSKAKVQSKKTGKKAKLVADQSAKGAVVRGKKVI